MTQSTPPDKTVLNVGCGPRGPSRVQDLFPMDLWREIRVDLDRRTGPDIVGSVTDLSMLPDGSVHAVWTSHLLEHLHRHEVAVALRECRRVLVPGGALVAAVPDLQLACELVAADRLDETLYVSPAGPITARDLIYGFDAAIAAGNLFMAHRTGFTPTVFGRDLQQAGFDPIILRRQPILELMAIAYRPSPDGRHVTGPFASAPPAP